MNRKHRRRALTAGLVASLALGAVFSQDPESERIIAMADIHGDFDAAFAMLQRAELLDADGQWIPGNHMLIQTGDFTDRGPQVRRVMDLLMSLERDAPDGQVVILLGNHEMMNITGVLSDVTDADYSSFLDSSSESRQRSAFADYVGFMEERARRLDLPIPTWTDETEAEWMEQHPPGFVEHREAFSPDGTYGGWLRELPAVAKDGDTLFLHAGIHPAISGLSVEEINLRVRMELRNFDVVKQYLVDQKLALPFFTLEELLSFSREELDFHTEETAAKQRQAAEIGESYEIPESLRAHIEILQVLPEVGSWLTFHPDGILWFRGFAEWTDTEGRPLIDDLLDRYGASQIVAGHTPARDGRIRSRFGGRLFLADTGMLSSVYRGGRASVLEIRGGVFRAIYMDEETTLERR